MHCAPPSPDDVLRFLVLDLAPYLFQFLLREDDVAIIESPRDAVSIPYHLSPGSSRTELASYVASLRTSITSPATLMPALCGPVLAVGSAGILTSGYN